MEGTCLARGVERGLRTKHKVHGYNANQIKVQCGKGEQFQKTYGDTLNNILGIFQEPNMHKAKEVQDLVPAPKLGVQHNT